MNDDQKNLHASTRIVAGFESIITKMQGQFGYTEEQVGLALMACGLNSLSRVWTGEEIVAHLSQILVKMAEHHAIDPETGKAIPETPAN